MQGTGVPLVTPFAADGSVDGDALASVVEWVVEQGVDFVVPCGSTGEAELMSVAERTLVVEAVADAVPDGVPVLAGTGHPGFEETMVQTERAADAGADGALVVTPHYYTHDQAALADYYRDVADASPIPLYLYSMPAYTGMRLDPRTVEGLATNENIAGMKDSSGDLEAFQRTRQFTAKEDFDLLVGSGSIYAAALDAGADGGILALANVVPERASEIYRLHQGSKDDAAREVNQRVVELNRAITSEHGVPGVKAAMRARGVPAGHVRRPFRPVNPTVERALSELVDAALP